MIPIFCSSFRSLLNTICSILVDSHVDRRTSLKIRVQTYLHRTCLLRSARLKSHFYAASLALIDPSSNNMPAFTSNMMPSQWPLIQRIRNGIPGPLLAKLTPLWKIYYVLRGSYRQVVGRLHERHGQLKPKSRLNTQD